MTDVSLNFNHKLMSKLTWAGLIPLAMTLFYAWIQDPGIPALLFLSFSAIVLAFVVGAQWGQVLFTATDEVDLRPVLIVTALVSLAAWTALFLGQPLLSTAALLGGYILSYAVENRFLSAAQPAWYRRLRLLATTAVAVMHGLMIARMMF